MATFGEKLKAARLNMGLTQAEVSEKLECAPTSLTNWENGKVQPSLEVLSKLCEVYPNYTELSEIMMTLRKIVL